MTGGGSLRIFASMMTNLDAGIGRALAALGRAGLEENTLVIFTSDNGGERYSFNWPFSSGKGSLWEGGIRVPAIVRWPGVIPAGRTTEKAACTMDWTATLLDVADTKPDAAHRLDGENPLTRLYRRARAVRQDALLAHVERRRGQTGPMEIPERFGNRAAFRTGGGPRRENIHLRRNIRTCSTRSGNSMRRGTARCCRAPQSDGSLSPCFGYTAAFTSRATRSPDSRAPCIQPSIQTEVCSPAKWILPSGRATCGNSELNWPGL